MTEETKIIESLKKDYDINCKTLSPLPFGADQEAKVFCADGTYFVKIKRGKKNEISLILLGELYGTGIHSLLAPLKTKNGKFFAEIEDFSLLVYPFVVGRNGFEKALTNHQWLKLGQALRQIHDFKVPSSIEYSIRRETYSPKWREAVLSIYAKMGTSEKTSKVGFLMQKWHEEIHLLIGRASQLAKVIEKKNPPFVLCHSDIHGGNVLLGESDELHIIDFDEPIMAPKERDLMFIGGGIENVWNKFEETELFYEGYGPTVVDHEILAYYRCERIIEDIAIYAEELLFVDQENQKMLGWLTTMFDPNGVVEIALKT